MFIRVSVANKIETEIINTSQIVTIVGNIIKMSNGDELDLMSGSLREVEENLFGLENAKVPGASEKTTDLLNELNSLVGGRGDAKPTTDRKARLKSRLKDFSEEELKQAAKNLGSDEFMQGANDNNKRYGTIDYLIRTSANVNKWLEDQPEKKKRGMF